MLVAGSLPTKGTHAFFFRTLPSRCFLSSLQRLRLADSLYSPADSVLFSKVQFYAFIWNRSKLLGAIVWSAVGRWVEMPAVYLQLWCLTVTSLIVVHLDNWTWHFERTLHKFYWSFQIKLDRCSCQIKSSKNACLFTKMINWSSTLFALDQKKTRFFVGDT